MFCIIYRSRATLGATLLKMVKRCMVGFAYFLGEITLFESNFLLILGYKVFNTELLQEHKGP